MNKKNREKLKLETRLCISTNDPCALCNRRSIRTVGVTETYLAGTDYWVCYDCAFGIDKNLAKFAYPVEHCPARREPLCDSYDFGAFPECGRRPDGWLNVGADHWCVCLKHGYRWYMGSNLFSSWKNQTEELHQANEEFLRRFREVYMTDRACLTRDPEKLESVRRIYLNKLRPDKLLDERGRPFAGAPPDKFRDDVLDEVPF